MKKLSICRICLRSEECLLFEVTSKSLQELYQKLTDIPFVTEDSRPIVACSFCCAKLKQCFRLMSKCLEAEELFAQMMNENYERKHLINQDQFELFHGFIRTSIDTISIVDVDQTESIVVKEELPAVCERLDDVIETKMEYDSHDIKKENPDSGNLDREDVLSLSHNIEEDSEDDVPLVDFKIEVKEEQIVSEQKQRAVEICYIKQEKRDSGDSDREENVLSLSHNIKEKPEDDVPLLEIKIKVKEEPEVAQKVSSEKKAVEKSWSTEGKKSKQHLRRSKVEDSIPTVKQKNQLLDSEINRNLLKARHVCEICQRSFNKKMSLSRHKRTHVTEKPYKCDVCQRSFSHKRYLKKHMLIHTGTKSYKCDVCQRSFTQSAHLTGHMVTHTGEKPYKCDVCQACFGRKSNLDQHNRVHTGKKNPYRKSGGGKPYQCDICQMSFSGKSVLIRHIRIHTGDKPYKCGICQRGFTQKPHLTTHIRTHTGEKPFKCDFCQRSFSDSGVLRKHIQIHTGEKPYKCGFCQRCFRSSPYLRNHIRRHTGEKPFHCNICQRSFHSKNTLKQHTRVKHSQEKPVQDDNNVSEDLV